MNFTREEIWDLKQRINKYYMGDGISPDWKRMAENLMNALDHFDACLARSEVKIDTTSTLK